LVSALTESKLVKGSTKDSVIRGFKLLVDNNILSIPLWDPELGAFVGFLDIIDIVHHFLSSLSQDEIRAGFSTWETKFSATLNKHVSLSHRNPWQGVEPSAPLQAVIDLLVHFKLHRIPVIDGSGHLITVLSQSRIVKYLSLYMQLFEWSKQTVRDLKLGYRDVIVVPSDTVTKDTFKVMRDSGVSGIGIIDPLTKKLVGQISTSDIRHVGYTEHMFERFYLIVRDFALLVHAAHPQVPMVTVVTPDTTLAEVGEMFNKYGVHRLFVVDSVENMQLIGVISLHDFLLVFGRPQ